MTFNLSKQTMIIIGILFILVILIFVFTRKSEKFSPSMYSYNLYVSPAAASTKFKFEDVENLIQSMQLAQQPSFGIIMIDSNIPSPYHARLMISDGPVVISNDFFCEYPPDVFTMLPEIIAKYPPSALGGESENEYKCYIEVSPIITTLLFSIDEINLLIVAYQIIGPEIEPQTIQIVNTIPEPYNAKIIRTDGMGVTIGQDILFGKDPSRFCYQVNSLASKVWDPTY